MSIKRYFAPEGKEQYQVKRQYKGSHARALYAPYGAMASVPRPIYRVFNRGPRRGLGELKAVDVPKAGYVINTTGSVTCLNLTAVGDDYTTRDGRQITLKSVQCIGHIYPEDQITDNHLARVLLVWDKANNSGAIATIANILSASDAVSGLNLDNRERFRILKDEVWAIGRQDNTATQAVSYCPATYSIKWFVNLKGLKTTYSGTTAAIGSIQSGALLLVTIGSLASGSASSLQMYTRVRFRDN